MAKKTTFQPYGQWILLPNPAKKITDSGIILDDKTAGAIVTNVLNVQAIGPDCNTTKVGDTVMVDPTVEARVLHLDEGEFILVAEYNILGKFS
jgi:co-chaperonin GroES (HSP10)|tara:strand:- start:11939 stop:12217 length:279 start_codon:yes stop_codon:yes gene_type:complete